MKSIEERFWSQVTKTDDCWLWTGKKNQKGYARFMLDKRRSRVAYRWAYEQTRGLVPEGLELDHLCRNRACVRPDHLEAVTHAENIRRGTSMDVQLRKTHCPQGHPYDAENTYRHNKRRHCKACQRIATARWAEAHKVERAAYHKARYRVMCK